jgi:cytoskeletal protein CcmA (bactofilin family)
MKKPSKPIRSETILGSGSHFEGNLTSEGHVRVHGKFVGDITAHGDILIGEAATVEGDVVGEAVTVGGVLRGDVVARKVSVLNTGRAWGDLRVQALTTEEGGFIQGQITMEEQIDLSEVLTPVDGLKVVANESELLPAEEPSAKK